MSILLFTHASHAILSWMAGKSQRAAALLEVLGVYLTGPVMMVGIRRVLGVSLTNPLPHLSAHATGAELVSASR